MLSLPFVSALAALVALAAPAAPSPPAPPSAWWQGADLIAARTAPAHPGLDQFWALGFSRTGRFAYLTIDCGDEAGYTCANATVVDLASDAVVEAIEYDGEDSTSVVGWASFGARVQQLLDRHGIDAPGTLADARFVAEQRFTVALSSKEVSRSANQGATRTTRVRLVRAGAAGNAAKDIGVVVEDIPFLDADVPPTVLAVALSPYERRAAVLVVDPFHGGCVGIRHRVHVLGAHLDERFTDGRR